MRQSPSRRQIRDRHLPEDLPLLRRLAPAIALLATLILDTTVLPIVYSGPYAVPLTLILVFLIGLIMGRMQGLLYGTVGGLLIDITSGTLGMMTFYFMACGFMIGFMLNDMEISPTPSRSGRRSRRRWLRPYLTRAVWIFALYTVGEIVLLMIQYYHTTELYLIYFINIALRGLICAALVLLFRPAARKLFLIRKPGKKPLINRQVRHF